MRYNGGHTEFFLLTKGTIKESSDEDKRTLGFHNSWRIS